MHARTILDFYSSGVDQRPAICRCLSRDIQVGGHSHLCFVRDDAVLKKGQHKKEDGWSRCGIVGCRMMKISMDLNDVSQTCVERVSVLEDIMCFDRIAAEFTSNSSQYSFKYR